MKLSTLALATAVFTVSSLANAKVSYIEGTVKKVDADSKVISIVENKSGEVKVFRYDESARNALGFLSPKRLSRLVSGEQITLKLKTTDSK